MVGYMTLNHVILVRIQVPQLGVERITAGLGLRKGSGKQNLCFPVEESRVLSLRTVGS